MMEPLITSRNLCKAFHSQDTKVEVIRDVDIEIYKGEFTVLMGNSGSGKSTLLYCLGGLETVTEGEV